MPIIPRPVWAEINLNSLAHNITEVCRIIEPGSEIMAVVKANAYGHGAIQSSRVFLENGAESLAVATLTEAIELRKASITDPILVLGYTPSNLAVEVLKWNINPTIYTLDCAEALSKTAENQHATAKIHIKVDTGLGRIGFQPNEDSLDAILKISKLPALKIEGIYTHFALADIKEKSYTKKQFEIFMNFLESLESQGVHLPKCHVSNSAAIIDLPEYSFDIVRPGCMLYGLYPSDEVDQKKVNLIPAMTLKAKLSFVKKVPQGTGISYGLTYTTKRVSRIGSLPLGYADGYSRILSNKAEVWVKEKRAPVVGRICMDQFMVDLTNIPDAVMGDEVILFGSGNNGVIRAEQIANWMGSIVDEVVTSVSRRIPRIFIKDGEIIEVVDYLLGNVNDENICD